MDTAMTDVGGFPTPPASSVAASQHPSPLPQPRRRPLRPGGPKESDLISYLDRALNDVQKSVENRMKKGQSEQRHPDVRGYTSFLEPATELDSLIDVVWVSGSPNLQIPYLLNIARMLTEYIPLFPASPRATFRIVDKLDSAFSNLLLGYDTETNAPLPGFENGRTMSTTDKVRLKGIVDRTRVIVAKKIGGNIQDDEEDGDNGATEERVSEYESTTEDEGDYVKFEGFEDNTDDEEDENVEREWEERHVGSIYERTIAELGDVLGGPPIGIITED
ncbi:hypothetical protein B0J11DRAFT_186103 [Dendryphion nanum]|uniref:Uncharacterized protein n=1 Tax=Dendryphion nanum TaxID=256645 RepID=A0A9P9IA66_9PLEO|nr:hypothetical protein B0J11DRAFT_186103 [Dendryphion nanum]